MKSQLDKSNADNGDIYQTKPDNTKTVCKRQHFGTIEVFCFGDQPVICITPVTAILAISTKQNLITPNPFASTNILVQSNYFVLVTKL